MSNPASRYAEILLGSLIAKGLTDIVLSPGSRSQALALAAADFESRGSIQLRVVVDERSAGFVALGVAMETKRPVVVITTSGSAVGNLMPAVMESSHAGVPLIAITADRPDELRGIASNQTTVQEKFFAPFTRNFYEIPAPTGGEKKSEIEKLAEKAWTSAQTGPVQINFAAREPLSGPTSSTETETGEIPQQYLLDTGQVDQQTGEVTPIKAGSAASDTGHSAAEVAENKNQWLALLKPRSLAIDPSANTVVIAGDKAGPEAQKLADEMRAPLFAEVTSGARFGPSAIIYWREILKTELRDQIEQVVIFGHPTLWREVAELCALPKVRTFVTPSPGIHQYVPAGASKVRIGRLSSKGHGDQRWLKQWRILDQEIETEQNPIESTADLSASEYARAEMLAGRESITRRSLVDAVWRHTWPHDRLIFGSSRLIRVADANVPRKNIVAYANRGLAGIDGTIATAVGVASSQPGTTRVLLGDLATLHDIGSLQLVAGLNNLQIIVGNDFGGSMFDLLEVKHSTDPGLFDRVMYTPHSTNFEGLSYGFGLEYKKAKTRTELEAALSENSERAVLIEVPLER